VGNWALLALVREQEFVQVWLKGRLCMKVRYFNFYMFMEGIMKIGLRYSSVNKKREGSGLER
jgi:hypothetical protein